MTSRNLRTGRAVGYLPSDEMFSLHWLVCDLIFKPERAGGSRSQDPSASPNHTLAAIVPTVPAKPRLFPQLPSPVLSFSSKPQFHSL